MKDTKIEWANSTWNPVTGCLHNCPYCYARRIATRFALPGGVCFHRDEPEKAKGIFIRNMSDSDTGEAVGVALEFTTPYLDEKGKAAAYPVGFEPTFHRYRLKQPKCWHEPKNIFVCSMADLFGKWVPDEWIEEVFKVCEETPQHNYMFLTKNPNRYLKLAKAGKLPTRENMWYGTTITRAKDLYMYCTDEWHSFLSIEPLLEDMGKWYSAEYEADNKPEWVVIGAESGNRKEKVTPEKDWVMRIAEDCSKYGIPLFMKDSLIPIVGEENMKREFPAGLRKEGQA